MGFVGYYNKFIEGFSKTTYPITSLEKNGVKFEWKIECKLSFDQLNHLLSTTVLKLADINKEFTMCEDACMEGLGGVLLQDNSVIEYESRKLKSHERIMLYTI